MVADGRLVYSGPDSLLGLRTHVAIAVDTNSVKVYYDGEEVCHAQSDTGTTLVAPDLVLIVMLVLICC